MVRQTKSKTAETEQVATTTVTADVISTESVPKVKKAKAPKTTTTETEVTPVVCEQAAAVVTDETPVSDTEAILADQTVEFGAKLQQLSVIIS